MPSFPPSGAVLAGHESGDVFAGAGVDTAFASLGATEGHDAFAGTGSITQGVISGAGGNDTAAIAGWCIVGTMGGAGRNDALAGLGGFATSGTAAPTAGSDTLTALGLLTASASMAVTAGSDTATSAGMLAAHGVLSMGGGADVLAALGFIDPPGVLTATGGNDTFSALGGMTTTAVLGATERHDVFAAFSSGLEYHIYSNTGIRGRIDYSSAIATTGLLTWTSGPLTYPGTWRFGVRAFNGFGEEENLDCAITLILDAAGNDISLRPAPPIGLRAFATAGGSIRVEWAYNTIKPSVVPIGFHVYIGTGGMPSYGSPAATVSFATAIAGTFVANLTSLTSGTTYTIGCRAYNAVTEEPNTSTVNCTADSSGPSAVVDLTATAIV